MLARVTPPVGMKRSAPGEESVTGRRGERGRAESGYGHTAMASEARRHEAQHRSSTVVSRSSREASNPSPSPSPSPNPQGGRAPYGAAKALRAEVPPRVSAGKNLRCVRPSPMARSISVGVATPGTMATPRSRHQRTTW